MNSRSGQRATYKGCWFCEEKQWLVSSCGLQIPIRNRALQVFLFLASKPNSVITSQEIESTVWKELVVTKDSLHQAIREIRKSIGDTERQVLKTIHRRGYQLIPDAEVPIKTSHADAAKIHSTTIQNTLSADQTKIAWRKIGNGQPILKASNWIADVDMAAGKLMYSEFYTWLASSYTFVRFDQRGTGLSDRNANDFSIDIMVADMKAIADAAKLDKFFLFGASQGAAYCIAFAKKYPERVLGLIFRGGMVVGPGASGDPAYKKWLDTAKTVVQNGWDSGDHAYRRYFSSRIAAEADADVLADLDEIQRLSISADKVIRIFEFIDRMDLQNVASEIDLPTLIMHSRDDVMVPFSEGRRLHRLMPHARFVTLDGANHAVLPGTPAFNQVCEAMSSFIDKVTLTQA